MTHGVPEFPSIIAGVKPGELDWHVDAACRKQPYMVRGDDIYYSSEFGRLQRESTARAKLICRGCLVKVECLNFALEHSENSGVWGGMTAEERRAYRLHNRRRVK